MFYQILLEKNLLPDTLIRQGIRYYNSKHLKTLKKKSDPQILEKLKHSPLALDTDKANAQHYEVPAAFYQKVLGKHLKYSCGHWDKAQTLDQSETEMLQLTTRHAALENGDTILELGCGWGSLTLYMAEQFPDSHITALSNSHSQREYIIQEAQKRNLTNIKVITQDINTFKTAEQFDRIVSVEMFEHLRNYKLIFSSLNDWLKPNATAFIHVFAHQKYAYLFEVEHARDWMAKYFFSGGTMPSIKTLPHFAKPLELEKQWPINGKHYEKTANAWLEKMDQNKETIFPLFQKTYGKEALKFWSFWRVFFMACAELFAHEEGKQWLVCHYLFRKK